MGGRMTSTLIRNGVIVPMEGRSSAIDGKSLLIDGDRIAVIDDAAVLEPQGGIDETIDATGKAWPASARH
jgi:imidazolonepropionase-like amidohydrolase